MLLFFFFQAEDGIRDLVRSRGLGDVYKRQPAVGFFDADLERRAAGDGLLHLACPDGAQQRGTELFGKTLSLIHI